MSSTIVTVRPTALASGGGDWAIGGGAGSKTAAVNDNSDATYIESSGTISAGAPYFDFADPTIPALAIIQSVRMRVRASRASGSSTRQMLLEDVGGSAVSPAFLDGYVPVPAITTFTLTSHAVDPSGAAWTQALLNAIQIAPTNTNDVMRIYELYVDVLYNQVPVVSAVTPTGGTQGTVRPTIGWTYSDPESDVQERYRVKVFSAAQYGAGGFDPETSASTWDSGEVFSAAISVAVTTDLVNTTVYKAYVKVADAGSNGRYSAWASSATGFTISIDAPAVPSLVAVADDANGRVLLTVVERENLLTANQADVETDLTGIFAFSGNVTVTRDTTKFRHGVASAKVLRNVAGSGSVGVILAAVTGSNLTAVPETATPVTPGKFYTGRASFLSAVTANTANVYLVWYTSAGVFISAVQGGSVTDNTSTWVEAIASGQAPPTAAFADLWAVYPTAPQNEAHFIDQMSIASSPSSNLASETQAGFPLSPGTVGTWNGNRCTLSWVPYDSFDGAACMRMEGTSSDPVAQYCNPGGGGAAANGIPVVASTVYHASARAKVLLIASGHTGAFRVGVDWYDAAGTFLSSSTAGTGTASATGFTVVEGDVTAPANARYAVPVIEGTGQNSAGSVLLVDCVGLMQGAGVSWGAGYPTVWTVAGRLNPTDLTTVNVYRFVEDPAANPLYLGLRIPAVSNAPAALGVGTADYYRIIDSDTASANYYQGAGGLQSVTVDLGDPFLVSAVRPWHFYSDGRTFHGTKTEVSLDGLVWQTIFDSTISGEYVETNSPPIRYLNDPRKIRYIRDWLNGSTVDGLNRWVEIQAWSPGLYKPIRTSPTTLPTPASVGSVTLADNEAQPGRTNFYSATLSAVLGGSSVASFAVDVQFVTPTATTCWLKNPFDPSQNVPVFIEGSLEDVEVEDQAIHYAVLRADPIVLAGAVRRRTWSAITFLCRNDSQAAQIKALRDEQRTLLLQGWVGDVGGLIESYYVRLGPEARRLNHMSAALQSADGQFLGGQVRELTYSAVEVAAP